MAGAQDVDYLYAERLHVKSAGNGAHIEKNLQAILFDKLLRKDRGDLLVFRVHEHQAEKF